jgi:hypothetical protein
LFIAARAAANFGRYALAERLHTGGRPDRIEGGRNGVSAAAKLERLVRILPGVAGYQDRENSRETDKRVRMRLSDEMKRLMRDLEADKRRLLEVGQRSALPLVDGLAGKLETLGRAIEYATRGYSGLFDLHKVDLKRLEQLYAFDLRLFDTLATLKSKAAAVRQAGSDAAALPRAITDMEAALDDFERTFDARRHVLTARE